VLRETFAEVAACRRSGIMIDTFEDRAGDLKWSPGLS
jgi:hypothetical protein